jgi:hypothetical protein
MCSFSATRFVELQAAKNKISKKQKESFFITLAVHLRSKIVFFNGLFPIRHN